MSFADIPYEPNDGVAESRLRRDDAVTQQRRGFMRLASLAAIGTVLAPIPLSFAAPPQQAGPGPFSPASPESVGMSPARLKHAFETAQAWVNDGRINGAVMLVIRRDRIVLNETVGWSDRERQIPMKPDTIFSLASMTKPFVGTAVLMLKEEGRLTFQDRASKYLPAFDNERSRDITIYHLLAMSAGFDAEAIFNVEPGKRYASLREAVDALGRKGPDVTPGKEHQYSGKATSTLAAIVAQISGMPAEDFIRTRILEPLGMADSFLDFRLKPGDPRAARVAAHYYRTANGKIAELSQYSAANLGDTGKTGPWTKIWDNTQPEPSPFFRAHGGLFTSAIDYAKFLSCMLHGGRFGNRRLLSEESVRLATSPTPESKEYGLHWTIFGDKVFGHGGAQGTLAWADKAHDLIGVYMTQSHYTGNTTRHEFRKLVDTAIVK